MLTEQSSLRAASWWIKWADLDWPKPDNQETVLRRADEFLASGVNTALVFGAHFRWDFMPFWTQLHDYMAAVREALQERGIALYDHHSAVLVHRYDTREEFRNVWLHSQPHLPFCPDRDNAASWNYKGRYLNDWRVLEIPDNKVYYSPRYTAEQFCCNNPEFVAAYCDYVRRLIKDTQIDGLMCDDCSFPGFHTCGCKACRQRFQAWSGHPLPAWGEESFWGNWKNPQWRHYCQDRFAAIGEFYQQVRAALPTPEYPMTACCSSSCSSGNIYSAHDLREQLKGCNLANLELVGNTPPGPLDNQAKFSARLVPAAVHIGIARERKLPSLAIGYGFVEDNANALWAMIKALGGNCWFSTLKGRLGLPERILRSLPGDAEPATRAFCFERDNPELFKGKPLARCKLLFSQYSHKQTAFGCMSKGYTRDFADTLNLLLEAGIMPELITELSGLKDTDLPLLLASVVGFTEPELEALQNFCASGGKVIAFGPCAYPSLKIDWQLPDRAGDKLELCATDWQRVWGSEIEAVKAEPLWHDLSAQISWHPWRLQDSPDFKTELLAKLRETLPPACGAELLSAQGFFASAFQYSPNIIRLFFVATQYEVEINKELDEMRYHRSRVNLYRSAPPCGQNGSVALKLQAGWKISRVILPLNSNPADWDSEGMIRLPENVVMLIVELRKKASQ
ncbi:MAG: hypothetical protein RBT25_01835 [Lentisphaeria bacterium]|nr:hypothetical protein [Lentisphaeria bacterium]NLZ59381.1 hypothetical protein [Lentisphaerota bacterium]